MHGRVFRIAALPGEQTHDFSSQTRTPQPLELAETRPHPEIPDETKPGLASYTQQA